MLASLSHGINNVLFDGVRSMLLLMLCHIFIFIYDYYFDIIIVNFMYLL